MQATKTRFSKVQKSGTDAAQQGLTSVIGQEPVLSLWRGRRLKKLMKSCSIGLTLPSVFEGRL